MPSLNCSMENPCKEGQGICHSDKDCMNDLRCNIANCDEKHYEKLHSMKKVLSPAMLRCCSKPQGNPASMKLVYIIAYDKYNQYSIVLHNICFQCNTLQILAI